MAQASAQALTGKGIFAETEANRLVSRNVGPGHPVQAIDRPEEKSKKQGYGGKNKDHKRSFKSIIKGRYGRLSNHAKDVTGRTKVSFLQFLNDFARLTLSIKIQE